MYSFHKQLHGPTGVEHSIYCNFYNSHSKNLVIAGANHLRVFRLIPDIQVNLNNEGTDQSSKMKLECLQSFSLYGEIVSLQAVRLSGSAHDALLLSFRDAKLSVVEYDPYMHDLKTLSLHYFEDDEIKLGRIQIIEEPIVRCDPDFRCAAMIIYGHEIIVFPFKKDATSDNVVDAGNLTGRAPLISSYKININEMDVKIANIIDMQFLHGYYEPTLLVLYEPIKTWAGRVAIRQDTCGMVAISLNIQQKVHPVIWSSDNLPFDCTQVHPVPKPIGGVLIFAVNSLLYLNQSIPPFGVSLNSLTEGSTAYPLKQQEGAKISLDCAQACFISLDRVVISLKTGELQILTLITDGMRSVRSFNIEKAAASVLTTCMCICEEGFLFLGSRLGNSLLLRYTEQIVKKEPVAEIKADGAEADGDNAEDTSKATSKVEPPNKKKRLDTLGDWMASNVSEIQDSEELEVYGCEKKTSTEITQYKFEVCDSLINIGPLGNVSMGEPAFLSEEYSSNIDPDVEVVSTSGYGKNGALSVLQRTIRPQVVTTFELPGCVDMWTVIGPKSVETVDISKDDETVEPDEIDGDENEDKEKEEESKVDFKNSHAFLIISRNENSMILQTGQEINELDHSGFSTQSTTVFAGNIGNNRFIVQISPNAIRLLEGVNQLQHIPMDSGSAIVHASVADPYLITLNEDGQIMILVLRESAQMIAKVKSGTSARLTVTKPVIDTTSKINTLCAYTDYSGLFTYETPSYANEPLQQGPGSSAIKSATTPLNQSVFNFMDKNDDLDEDDLLYSSESQPTPSVAVKSEPDLPQTTTPASASRKIEPTHWLFVCRENGMMQIYSLPDMKVVLLVKNFPMGLKLLSDNIQVASSSDKSSDKQKESMPLVKEILVIGLGQQKKRPLLMARVRESVLMYEAFPFYDSQIENHLKIRFSKISHNMITQERKIHRSKKRNENETRTSGETRQMQLRYFEDIAGYSGVFVCGPYPYWIFMTSHGELRFHAMPIDGNIPVFASFHNVNCVKGFLYFNKTGELRICVLPTHVSYDAPWPVRKVPLRCTPHFVTYHAESKTYCVVTSNANACDQLVKHIGEEKEFETMERDDRFIFPTVDKFCVQLFSPVNWEAIPNTKFELEEWEHATALKTVLLASEGTMSGLKGYIAVATNYNYGEDVTSRGRILISDIIDVVPEPGQPLTKNKMKMIYSKEQKGPVTTLCHVQGFLLSSIGQKIYVWQLKDNDLIGIAFIDTHIYVHSAVSIKNLILVADICKSVTLLCYQEETRTLALVSRDVKPNEIYAVEYIVDNNQLGFLVSDVDKNVVLYSYQPEAHESFGGQYLLRKGDIHIGSYINSFLRIRCKLSDLQNDKKTLLTFEKRHVTMYFTQDGSIGALIPVSEKVYRRLLMLQNLMSTHIPHVAGLNPRAYRLYKSSQRQLINPSKNILDGDLLWRFMNLSLTEKMELAKKIGTQIEMVTDDLLDIDRCTAHF